MSISGHMLKSRDGFCSVWVLGSVRVLVKFVKKGSGSMTIRVRFGSGSRICLVPFCYKI